MGARESFQKLIDKKKAEIDNLEQQLRDARIYIQAIQDSLRLLPKEENGQSSTTKELRVGSNLALVQEYLKRKGSPQHISTILQFLGKPNDKSNRLSLVGSLGAYVREKRIFTRPGPNIFGLFEFEDLENDPKEDHDTDSIPEEFGKL